MEFYNKPLTTGEAAKAFRVSLKTVQQWVDRGLLECWKTPGGHRRISPQSMAELQARLNAWSLSRKRLLLVCPDHQGCAHYVDLLQDINPEHEVRVVNSGLQAMLQMARWHPDFVIFDLPVAGIELELMVITIKQDRELSRTQLVLLTDQANPPKLDHLVTLTRKDISPAALKQEFLRLTTHPASRIPTVR